jgi:hypothetical protein
MTFIHMGKFITPWKFPCCAIESHFFNQIAKGEKKGTFGQVPMGDGEWSMFAACPKEFGYISLRKTYVPKDIVLYFYILSLISSLHVMVYNIEGCIMDEMLKYLITLPYKNIQKNWIIFFFKNLEGCTIDECSTSFLQLFIHCENLKSSFQQSSNLFPNIFIHGATFVDSLSFIW